MRIKKPAMWNKENKTVTIQLTNEQFELVEMWGFNVVWSFRYSKKQNKEQKEEE